MSAPTAVIIGIVGVFLLRYAISNVFPQVTPVCKFVMSHDPDDPYYASFRKGVSHVFKDHGILMEYINVPDPEIGWVAFKDAVMAESSTHSYIVCNMPPDEDVELSNDTVGCIAVSNSSDDPLVDSSSVVYRVGPDTTGLLFEALGATSARPALVSVPWTVDPTGLGSDVTIVRNDMSELEKASQTSSRPFEAVIVPANFDKLTLQQWFPSAVIVSVGTQVDPISDISVYQDPVEQGSACALAFISLSQRKGFRIFPTHRVNTLIRIWRSSDTPLLIVRKTTGRYPTYGKHESFTRS